jgi:hypothetical protein
MKKNIINIKGAILFFVLALSASCSDNFLDRPSEDGFDSSNFYASDEQVTRSTSAMYGKIWAPFFTKCFYALSEVTSGNLYAGDDGTELIQFHASSESPLLLNPWGTCFGVVAQSNNLINSLRTSVGPDVSPAVLENTIAEAHFMRAIAYFYLVRIWGEVPIIENGLDYVTNPNINTNRVEDVYTLIERDFQYAADHLQSKVRGANYSQNIRVSSGSAKAFLAKVYLYRKEYAKARSLAEEVINSGEFKLLPNYGDLFRIKNNNNEESIFSWQWIVDGGYQDANFSNVQYGPDVLNEVSYGATYIPSKDIIKAFEAGDKRKRETIMTDGDYYPELTHDGGVGFTCSADNGFLDATGALVKKYVVGKASAETGVQDSWGGTSSCNYIMRYSDLLLIHAEAIMAGNAETTDAAALLSFNKVRLRAGLPAKTKITHKDMMQERRIELAFEGEYWYDLCRLPANEAISIMSQQDRSAYTDTPAYYTPTEADLLYPKPSNDVNKNPKLNEPAVPYVFK